MNKKNYPKFYKTIIDSPQWQEWERYNSFESHEWDVTESRETGWLSPEHFQTFIKFVKEKNV